MRSSTFVTAVSIVLLFVLPVSAQVVVATIPAGRNPGAVAVNPTTNKIYVVNQCGDDPACQSNATVIVIDGTSLATQTVPVGIDSYQGVPAIAINHITNKIYVPSCGADRYCRSNGILTIIDGATLATTSVPVGILPESVAVNETTNKIYVVNACGADPGCASHGTMTVIDGATLATTSVDVGAGNSDPTTPRYSKAAIDSRRNRIYVMNPTCGYNYCYTNGTVTVVNGLTLATNTVQVGLGPLAIAVNPTTNKIYVANGGPDDSSVSIIDGATLSSTKVMLNDYPPMDVAVNAITNKIYVGQLIEGSVIDGTTLQITSFLIAYAPRMIVDPDRNKVYAPSTQSNSLTVADGITLATTKLGVGTRPLDAAVNRTTNRIYVANFCATDQGCTYGAPGSVSVIDGTPPAALQFVPMPPCRFVDTRVTGNPVYGGTSEDFPVPQLGGCNVPANAGAYSLNVTIVPPSKHPVAYLTIYPTGVARPNSSLMNSDGRFKANAAIVPAGTNGSVSIFASDTTDVVLDINGYFEPPTGSTLAFYSVPPCRIADTRWANGHLGGPYLHAGVQRDLPVLESGCGIPNTARAYSMNFTVIPRTGPVYVFTAWPAGQSQPRTSTLNAPTGTIVANAAIVPAGAGGDIDVLSSDAADLALDISGYFAPADTGGMSLYTVPPCRVLDTRKVGTKLPFSGQWSTPINVPRSMCGISSAAKAYVLNATTVPAAPLYYLILWPDGQGQPTISTLNALDAAVTSNMAIVPSGNHSIDAYAAGLTHLILDISGYFAPSN